MALSAVNTTWILVSACASERHACETYENVESVPPFKVMTFSPAGTEAKEAASSSAKLSSVAQSPVDGAETPTVLIVFDRPNMSTTVSGSLS